MNSCEKEFNLKTCTRKCRDYRKCKEQYDQEQREIIESLDHVYNPEKSRRDSRRKLNQLKNRYK